MRRLFFAAFVWSLCLAGLVSAETVRLATYNIENFRHHFAGHRISQMQLPPDLPEAIRELIENERRQNNRFNWMISEVFKDPAFNADIVVIQEAAAEEDLRFFNRRWLGGMYETIFVQPSNTTRDQHLAVMVRGGFRVLERREDFYKEPDPVENPRGQRLFARGPGFFLVETPGGNRLWVGNTHQKSKVDNSLENTRWRNREAVRTHQIMRELESEGPTHVILLGDFNDTLGIDEFELEGGGDTVANLVGPPEHGFVLATKPLHEAGKISFGGYWFEDRRSLIDHIVVSRSLAPKVRAVDVVQTPAAAFASDHFPVVIELDFTDGGAP